MTSLKILWKYLDTENISINKEEFDFQFSSHPDFPTLLALCDTLSFFNIDNSAFKIDKSEIDLLPNTFIARLREDNSTFLSFVEKKVETIHYTNQKEQKQSISKVDFEILWDDVVLLVENSNHDAKQKSKKWDKHLLLVVSISLFLAIVLIDFSNIFNILFFIFPIIGLLLSFAALKDLFNTKNKLLDKFCNISSVSSCDSVINSTKWKIFDVLNFSDLSIIFFLVQFCSLFVMGLSKQYTDYFSIQFILLSLAIPVLMASIYYQKFVEKKWCPICLLISGVVVLELCVIILQKNFVFNITYLGLLLFLAISTLLISIWFPFKEILKKLNYLKTVEVKNNRFKRNYTVLKKMLVSSVQYTFPKNFLIFGNPQAILNISIITNPFCGHCIEPHNLLQSIIDKYRDHLNVTFLYNVDHNNIQLGRFVKIITSLRVNNGEKAYFKAMENWYRFQNLEKWLDEYQNVNIDIEIDEDLQNQGRWFNKYGFNFTPCLFINGYRYPEQYDITDLPFFIEELISDKSLKNDNMIIIK